VALRTPLFMQGGGDSLIYIQSQPHCKRLSNRGFSRMRRIIADYQRQSVATADFRGHEGSTRIISANPSQPRIFADAKDQRGLSAPIRRIRVNPWLLLYDPGKWL
jgi:hypothetical protein